ncbi:hypothetical protein V6N11_054979 [Hibiscus sabdariffa]|uniref:Uncharacterized protein n=1 Tax=Hibiscus sabdariffa TaxID=183260 RepID=A0ABR2P4A3_9ROSI
MRRAMTSSHDKAQLTKSSHSPLHPQGQSSLSNEAQFSDGHASLYGSDRCGSHVGDTVAEQADPNRMDGSPNVEVTSVSRRGEIDVPKGRIDSAGHGCWNP